MDKQEIKYKSLITGDEVCWSSASQWYMGRDRNFTYPKEVVEQGKDWQRVEEKIPVKVRYCFPNEVNILHRVLVISKPLDGFEVLAIESLLNEEKESIWSDADMIDFVNFSYEHYNDNTSVEQDFNNWLQFKKGIENN